LTGKVVSVNAKDQTVAIDGAAIPNFMEAMTMDYPVKEKADLEPLHTGDRISATVDVSDDGSYSLSHIQVQPIAAVK
jgi:protein SCO1/2